MDRQCVRDPAATRFDNYKCDTHGSGQKTATPHYAERQMWLR
jgi:hypothetical protein